MTSWLRYFPTDWTGLGNVSVLVLAIVCVISCISVCPFVCLCVTLYVIIWQTKKANTPASSPTSWESKFQPTKCRQQPSEQILKFWMETLVFLITVRVRFHRLISGQRPVECTIRKPFLWEVNRTSLDVSFTSSKMYQDTILFNPLIKCISRQAVSNVPLPEPFYCLCSIRPRIVEFFCVVPETGYITWN